MKKILFVTYGGGHVKTLLPIIKNLKKIYNVDIIALGMAANLLKEENIDFMKIISFASENELKIGNKLALKFHDNGQGITFEDTAAYYGVGYNQLKNDYPKKYKKLFDAMERRTFFPKNFFKRILVKNNYDLIISTNTSGRYERAAIQAANELNILTATFEDLLGTAISFSPNLDIFCKDNNQLEYCKKLGLKSEILIENNIDQYFDSYIFNRSGEGFWSKVKSNTIPNIIFVNSEYTKKSLIKKGINSNIYVTGNPKYKDIKNKKYNFTNAKVLNFVYTAQPTKNRKKIITKLISLSKKIDDFNFIIKPHPVDREDYMTQYKIKKSDDIIVLDRNKDIFDVLENTDILFTEYSTTALDAIYTGTMVITYSTKVDIDVYSNTNLVLNINTLDDLEDTLLKVIDQKEILKKNFISHQKNFINNFDAINKIREIIESELKENEK